MATDAITVLTQTPVQSNPRDGGNLDAQPPSGGYIIPANHIYSTDNAQAQITRDPVKTAPRDGGNMDAVPPAGSWRGDPHYTTDNGTVATQQACVVSASPVSSRELVWIDYVNASKVQVALGLASPGAEGYTS